MQIIKKILNYQKMLIWSAQPGNIDASLIKDRPTLGCLPFILFFFIMMIILSNTTNALGIVFFTFASTFMSYGIIASKREWHRIVPVTKKFSFLNMYLLPLIMLALSVVAYYLGIGLLILIAIIPTFFAVPSNDAAEATNTFVNTISGETILLSILLILSVLIITISIAMIASSKKRICLLTMLIIATSSFMIWIHSITPKIQESTEFGVSPYFFELQGIEKIHNIDIILICMAAFLVVTTPIAIRYAYKEYMKEIE